MKKILWRLSIVPWILLIIICYIFIFPLKWLLTGKFRLCQNECKWLYKWTNNIYKK